MAALTDGIARSNQLVVRHFQNEGPATYGAVISGSYTGAPGQPLPRDLKQRDKARRLADRLIPGSPEERFYRSVERSAEEQMQWRADHAAKLLDGREW